MSFVELGEIEYGQAWELQKQYFNNAIKKKKKGEAVENKIFFCTHPNVFTMGKSANANNVLFSKEELKEKNISLFQIDRGGDVTFHGVGQVVVYPILDLESFNIGPKKYVYLLEEIVIETLKTFGIDAFRLDKAPGVWVGNESDFGECKKICALGIKTNRYITMHGLALNVNTDLNFFRMINPCGFDSGQVTTMSKELNKKIDGTELTQVMKEKFSSILLKNQNS